MGIVRIVLKPVMMLLSRVFGFSLYLVFCLAKPFKKLHLGILGYGRLGQLSLNTERFLRWRALNGEDGKSFYIFLSGRPVNRQLLRMIKRRLCVLEFPFAEFLYRHGLKAFFAQSSLDVDVRLEYAWSELNQGGPELSFSPEEEVQGKELLKSLGIEPGTSYVCFHARDGAYLNRMHPNVCPTGWGYHDYRNCDIDHYLAAVQYLASQGFYALRMGYIVEKPIACQNPRVIDYASHHRSDFGDIYLLAHCRFYLGTNSGIADASAIFGVPATWANVVPLGHFPWRQTDLFIPKKYWAVRERRFLTFREIFERRADLYMLRAHEFEKAGIELVENTPQEILALAKEMKARLDGTWKAEGEDEELQARLRSIFPPSPRITGHPPRMGGEFLRQNRELLE